MVDNRLSGSQGCVRLKATRPPLCLRLGQHPEWLLQEEVGFAISESEATALSDGTVLPGRDKAAAD